MDTSSTCGIPATVHKPVLLKDVLHVLAIQPDDTVIDGTLGGGGHAGAILAQLGANGVYLAIDADMYAIERARNRFASDNRVQFEVGNFRNMDMYAEKHGITKAHKILFDIGLSSDQLEGKHGRGFSFLKDQPLKMTFTANPKPGELTAWHVVNEWSEASLADIIFGFGGERKARTIARAIVEARTDKEIHTSGRLADIVACAAPKRGHVHPATKTFQAIRMAVNDEVGALTQALEKSKLLLQNGGRVAVITFHSIEDRIVKRTFMEWEKSGTGERVTKKPIKPETEEVRENPRARSAKLRCFKKQEN